MWETHRKIKEVSELSPVLLLYGNARILIIQIFRIYANIREGHLQGTGNRRYNQRQKKKPNSKWFSYCILYAFQNVVCLQTNLKKGTLSIRNGNETCLAKYS